MALSAAGKAERDSSKRYIPGLKAHFGPPNELCRSYPPANEPIFSSLLDLPAYAFELLHKSRNLLEHALLLGQVLRI